MEINRPVGTDDLIGRTARSWQKMRRIADEVFSTYGFQLIETPLFEQTQLFNRGIGESTDVVSKEMFTVLSPDAFKKTVAGERLKDNQRLTLRPEGTAGAVRAILEDGLLPTGAAPVKLMYAGSMFRAERPQKGRLRQFHQIGVECVGADEPSADAEVIIMLMRFFERLGLPQESMTLYLNSMGDDRCRPAYRDSVRDYIHAHAEELCDDCNRRAELNPLRAFDCKNEHCHEVMEGAPKISDALCDDCRRHYTTVKRYLEQAGIVYKEDPRLVRGLDYYTRTVFEVQVTEGLGSQSAIGGGGRYDKLMATIGGKDVPGLGFAVGFERIMLALEAAGVDLAEEPGTDVYVAAVDETTRDLAFSVLMRLRDAGVAAEGDHQRRSLKSQFKQADRFKAKVCIVCGPDEAAAGQVTLRDMSTHEQTSADIEGIIDHCVKAGYIDPLR